jgi:hypothetical protein
MSDYVSVPRFIVENFAASTDVPRYKRICEEALAAATAEAGNAIEDRNVWKRVVPPEEVGAEPDAERDAARLNYIFDCEIKAARQYIPVDAETFKAKRRAAIDAAMKGEKA